MRKYALISFCLHLPLAWWLWERKPVTRSATAAVAQPVELRGPRAGGRRGQGVSWRALRPRGTFGPSKGVRPAFTEDGDTSGWRSTDFGVDGGGFKSIKHTLRFEQIRREVEGMLNYPYPLARRGIEGTINVRLNFAADGRCDVRRARVDGGSAYLRVYVLALLKKLCALEQVRLPEPMNLDLSFAFLITDGQPRDGITGNVLMFTRTFPKSWADYQLGPIRGVWFAPVVSLDWPWVVEHWEEWVDGRDPLAAFR